MVPAMKYVLAGLAIVAAVAALFFRPPHADWGLPNSSSAIGPAPPPSSEPAGRFAIARLPPAQRVVVYVAGEVTKPGVYELAPGARGQDALARAGGPKADADLVAVNLAAPVEDGAEIAVPKIGESKPLRSRRSASPHPRTPRSRHGQGHGRRNRPEPQSPAAQSIDLNSADETELEAVPGVGPALAERIIAYREANGPFVSVDELADVSGITPRLQDELADMVVIR